MILVAPTSFKGTHSASAAAQAMARAAASYGLEITTQPVSDGGPGLIEALAANTSAEIRYVQVTGPLGAGTRARVLLHDGRAVVESADACGLHLIPPAQRSPIAATSFGVGELLIAARQYASEIVIGLGGSATIDCGVGMARALGYRMLDADGNELPAQDAVLRLSRITGRSSLTGRVTALADVHNPLTGPNGAARVFGPQKGAAPEQVERLDNALAQVAGALQRDLHVDVGQLRGAGAAGGLGAGLHAFAQADVVAGSEWLLREIDIDALMARASLLITGEGCYDAQSGMGKITGELIARAGRAGVRVLLVAGRVEGALPQHVRVLSANRHLELEDIERMTREALPTALAAR